MKLSNHAQKPAPNNLLACWRWCRYLFAGRWGAVSTIRRRHRTITHAKKGLDAMLVLSRKVGERILIGDQIAITVVRLGQGAVRIGVDAPGQMTVVREELVQRAADHPASEVILS